MKDILSGEVFDFIINESVESKEVWNYNGGMIDGRTGGNLDNSRIGVEFMSSIIQEFKPKRLLETGTNYGSFSHVVYSNLDEFELHTCDLVADSGRCVDFINNANGKNNVTFHNKMSVDFLAELKESGVQYDFAWIDSAHNYDYLMKEMNLVGEMQVPIIVVDDFSWVRGIQLAVFDFLIKHENYKFYKYSNNNTQIGSIVVLKKVDESF
jgi:cephalosporin hydroxylase